MMQYTNVIRMMNICKHRVGLYYGRVAIVEMNYNNNQIKMVEIIL